MAAESSRKIEADRKLLEEARTKGGLATMFAYVKLSGPGWLQSALTLGGGSLASSLYLGVLSGFALLWLQPIAMVLGIIMLSAIGYVTMSTGERPFAAINRHVNPVLGWSWVLASLLANIVWCLPQYSLANGVLQQTLLPGVFGADGPLGDTGSKLVISIAILLFTTTVTWSYDRGGLGVRLYELVLKIMVAVIVLCFFGVVFSLSTSSEGLAWGDILGGFIPDLSRITSPAASFEPLLAATGDGREYWSNLIVDKQRDVLVAAAATAVGINMTYLFPYSLLKRGWGKEFRGFSKFDLGTGMLIPFVLATSCVVIASSTQFHAAPQPGLATPVAAGEAAPSKKQLSQYIGLLNARLEAKEETKVATKDGETDRDLAIVASELAERVPEPDRVLAATLVERDARDLSRALEPLLGKFFGDVVFGIGVLGMALSTITLLMLISGMIVCELCGLPPTGKPFRLGTLVAAAGVLGPFLWSKAAFYLAVPTSVFGLMLLPLAYLTFFFLMNQKKLLGDECPTGGRRVVWNVLMGIAAGVATFASVSMVWIKAGWWGIGAIGVIVLAALVVHFQRRGRRDDLEHIDS